MSDDFQKKKLIMHNSKPLFLLTVSLVISALLSFLSMVEYAKIAAGVFSGWEGWHYAHMTGMAPSPLQQRILSFLIPETLNKIFGFNILHAYLLERFVFLTLSGVAMFTLANRFISSERSLAAVVIFFLFYNLSALAHIQPAEEINIFIFALCFLFIDSNRFGQLLLLAAIGATTKVTIIFIVPIYFVFCLLTNRPRIRTLWESSLLGCVIIGITIGISQYYSEPRDYLGGFWQYSYNTQQLLNFSPQSIPFLFVSIVPAACIFFTWHKQPKIIQATALICPFFVIGHYLISRVEEFRTFMPLAVLLIIGLVIFFHNILRVESSLSTPTR